MGDGAANGGAVPHAPQSDVVDVLRAAQDLCLPLFAGGGLADDLGSFGHRVASRIERKLVDREVLMCCPPFSGHPLPPRVILDVKCLCSMVCDVVISVKYS